MPLRKERRAPPKPPRPPKPKLPTVKVRKPRAPKISAPSLPKMSAPKLPSVSLPKVRVPRPRLPSVHVPRPHLPRFHLPRPRLPSVRLPRPRLPRFDGELLLPTVKVALALAVTIAAAAALGSALGLPLPLSGTKSGDANFADASALAPGLDQGTAAAVAAGGPYFPVLGPVDYGELAAHFGGGRGHPAQDMLTKKGTPLIAVRNGTIADGGTVNGKYSGGRGNYLYLWSPQDKRTYAYEHMLDPSPLHVGDTVTAGEYVGRVGCTGSCDSPHLHFEIRLGLDDLRHDPKPIDPLPLLKQWGNPPADALTGSPDR